MPIPSGYPSPMHDARIDALARQRVCYSTSLKKGEKVLIDLHDVPDSIGLGLIRKDGVFLVKSLEKLNG